jgi:hypothetical protein
MLTVNYAECHTNAPYADCHYAECHTNAPYADCHYSECRYSECRGALAE